GEQFRSFEGDYICERNWAAIRDGDALYKNAIKKFLSQRRGISWHPFTCADGRGCSSHLPAWPADSNRSRAPTRNVAVRGDRDVQRLFKTKSEFSFGFDANLLAVLYGCRRCPSAATDSGANCSTFFAAGNCPDHRANAGADAGLLHGLLSLRFAESLISVAGDRVGLVVDVHAIKLQVDFTFTGKV